MKKRYIFGAIFTIVALFFLVSVFFEAKDDSVVQNSMMPRIGQKLWTYNMNKHQWHAFSNNDDPESKEEIVLQVQQAEGNGGYTSYKLLTGNAQVPKEDVWFGESSQEFLVGKNLYSYNPRYFQYYQVVFNGVKFVTRQISDDELESIMKGFEPIKVSQLKNGPLKIPFSKSKNSFVVINDVGDTFYKYYIVPNDSQKMQLGDYSNQFTVKDKTTIKLQRLEGCSKAYPCYEIEIQ